MDKMNFDEHLLNDMLAESLDIHNSNDDRLFEMAKIGRFKNLYIYIWMNDGGNIPHFHISDSANYPQNSTVEIAVKILTPEYFPHGGKYTDKLNSREIKALIDFLKKSEDGESNWQYLIKTWNRNNSGAKIPPKTPMPDYTQLS
ncbi:MAG: hypothetical protein HDS01_05165 [Bacteroides sp.]|nr:hypothetical protein [Bacteroides sp.]